MRSRCSIALWLLGVAVIGYVSFRAGVNVAMARGAYADSVPIKEEQKCFDSEDIECLRMHWTMRAGINAEVARRVLESPMPTTVDAELKAYVQWAEQVPRGWPSERK